MKRKSKTKSGLLIIATFLLVSCASVGVSTIKHYPAKPKDCSLEVFTSESEIKKEYEVIALIDSKTGQTEFSNKRWRDRYYCRTFGNTCICGS